MNVEELVEEIRDQIKTNRVVIYIKGTKQMPVCGFSRKVVQILNNLEVDFEAYNALEDERYRPALKSVSDWPTFPQIFVNGQFMGGCDILVELYETGQLKELLQTAHQN